MARSAERDVLIVGAGPVGLFLAHALGRLGLAVAILEKSAALTDQPRAIAIDDESLRALDRLGLQQALSDRIAYDLPVRFLSGSGQVLMSIGNMAQEYGFPPVNSFYQPHLEALLLRSLDQFETVDVLFGTEVTGLVQDDDAVRVEAVGRDGVPLTFHAPYAVGCDGGHSFVRRALGVSVKGSTYQQRWLILDTGGDALGARNVTFHCDPARPTVSIFRVGGQRRWEFMLKNDENEADLMDPATIRALLARHGAAPERIERKVIYKFHSRIADRLHVGRVFLAGDSAHLTPPFAGQGLNGGIRDAVNLAWRLPLLIAGADRELETGYERERRAHVRAMTRLADGLGQVIMASHPVTVAVRDRMFGLLNRSSRLVAFSDRGGIRPEPRLPKGPLMHRSRKCRFSGRAIRRPLVVAADGTALSLDRLLGTSFSIFAYGAEVAHAAAARPRDWAALPPTRIVLLGNEAEWRSLPDGWVGALDPSGLLRRIAGRNVRGACLIRPDSYVARHFDPADAAEVGRWFVAAVGPAWLDAIPAAGQLCEEACLPACAIGKLRSPPS
jgi:3-(3-hydroxy-phenyl)propionate hydroxylase